MSERVCPDCEGVHTATIERSLWLLNTDKEGEQ